MSHATTPKMSFEGEVTAVKARIRLLRSFDEVSHQYQGYTLVMRGVLQWDPSQVRWRYEAHCYGPRDCPRYKAGKPRRVQGRKPWMVWEDDDVEREARGDA